MKETVIVKLGGSVITDKSGDCTIDYDRLNTLATGFAKRSNQNIILVHGAGSCGHPEAKRHHLDKGLDPNNVSGIFTTHRAVRKLNDAVVNALRASGVEAIGIHPLDACTAKNGRLNIFNCRPVELLVQHGIVPVLHGDVVLDEIRGACIISGDQLVSRLPFEMKVDRIGLATDVAGVLDGRNVIPRINAASVDSLEICGSGNMDVTGGMKGKIDELLSLAEKGIESNIFHVSRLSDFLDGRDHGGTVVTR